MTEVPDRRPRRVGAIRPYLVTGGRTRAAGPAVALECQLVATGTLPPPTIEPEHRAILDLCAEPASVVELSSTLTLPVGVVRVLVADLSRDGAIQVCDQLVDPDTDILRRLIDRVRSI